MDADYGLLLQTIRHWINVQPEEEAIIPTLFERRSISANDFFLRAGNVCHFVGFVVIHSAAWIYGLTALTAWIVSYFLLRPKK